MTRGRIVALGCVVKCADGVVRTTSRGLQPARPQEASAAPRAVVAFAANAANTANAETQCRSRVVRLWSRWQW